MTILIGLTYDTDLVDQLPKGFDPDNPPKGKWWDGTLVKLTAKVFDSVTRKVPPGSYTIKWESLDRSGINYFTYDEDNETYTHIDPPITSVDSDTGISIVYAGHISPAYTHMRANLVPNDAPPQDVGIVFCTVADNTADGAPPAIQIGDDGKVKLPWIKSGFTLPEASTMATIPGRDQLSWAPVWMAQIDLTKNPPKIKNKFLLKPVQRYDDIYNNGISVPYANMEDNGATSSNNIIQYMTQPTSGGSSANVAEWAEYTATGTAWIQPPTDNIDDSYPSVIVVDEDGIQIPPTIPYNNDDFVNKGNTGDYLWMKIPNIDDETIFSDNDKITMYYYINGYTKTSGGEEINSYIPTEPVLVSTLRDQTDPPPGVVVLSASALDYIFADPAKTNAGLQAAYQVNDDSWAASDLWETAFTPDDNSEKKRR